MTTPAFTFTQQVDGMTVLEVEVFAAPATQLGPNGLLQTGLSFTFETTLAEGYRVDLNGFFLDTGEDGGLLTRVGTGRANSGNNMNGGNNDGYDYAVQLGTLGGNDVDFTEGSVFIAGLALDQLVGADAGLRATSFGLDGEGSLKLVDDYTPPPPPGDDFPLWGQDISNVVLVFNTTNGDTKPIIPGPAPDGDGYYTVKIDEWLTPADDDLDNSIDDILAWLIANDPNVDADTELLGAIIKGGQQDTNFYAFGDNNTNGTDPDPLPDGIGLTLPLDDPDTPNNEAAGNATPPSAIDTSYDYVDVFPTPVPDQIFV